VAAFDHRDDPRDYLWRVVALPRAQSRIDRERVDPGGRAFNHHLPGCVEVFPIARRYNPSKQHRSNGRFGGRIDRVRPRRDDAGDHDSRIRPRGHASNPRRRSRRITRHIDDDPAAPRIDCR
jgi:hypothetical protein